MRERRLLDRLMSQKSNLLMLPSHQPQANLETLPDLVEPVVGWRVWKVWAPLPGSEACPTLSSVILDTPWAPRRKITAEHSFDLGARCRGLVESDCSCGIYAFKDPSDAFTYLMRVRDRQVGMSVEVALGTVSLWGKVIDCERGFKAQFAYPRHIYLPATISRFVSTVSSAFGVAVGIYSSTRDEKISIATSPGGCSQDYQILHLKKPNFPGFEHLAFEVGFYDLATCAVRLT